MSQSTINQQHQYDVAAGQQHGGPTGSRSPIEQASHIEQGMPLQQERLDSNVMLADEKGVSAEPLQRVITINWDGPDDPQNPKNWSQRRKWACTLTVAMFTFISPIASSMVAPALEDVAKDLNVPPGFQTSLLLSIFILSYAFGPLLLGPLSEVFGRTRVLQSSFMFFMVFCLACGFAQNKAQFLVFRIISGLGGSAPLAIGPGVLSDLWPAEQRGKALGYYTAGPLLGPAIGKHTMTKISISNHKDQVLYLVALLLKILHGVGFSGPLQLTPAWSRSSVSSCLGRPMRHCSWLGRQLEQPKRRT